MLDPSTARRIQALIGHASLQNDHGATGHTFAMERIHCDEHHQWI
jgi:hypothetical protein